MNFLQKTMSTKQFNMRVVILTIIPVLLIISTRIAFGATDLIPCEGTPESPCGFNELFIVINAVIHFILSYLLLPVAVITLVYGGWLYFTSGSNASKRKEANEMFKKLFIGIFFCLTAWVIVKVILETLGYDTSSFSTIIGL